MVVKAHLSMLEVVIVADSSTTDQSQRLSTLPGVTYAGQGLAFQREDPVWGNLKSNATAAAAAAPSPAASAGGRKLLLETTTCRK